jgi:hypothetical protein
VRRLYVAANNVETILLIEVLKSKGIPAFALKDVLQGALGEIPFIETWPEVWLEQDSQYEIAKKVVDDWQSTKTLGSIVCDACEEHSPSEFELCWNCGAAFDN